MSESFKVPSFKGEDNNEWWLKFKAMKFKAFGRIKEGHIKCLNLINGSDCDPETKKEQVSNKKEK